MEKAKVAAYIQMLKLRSGKTYEQAEAESNVPKSTINRIALAQAGDPGIEIVEKVIEAFGGSMEELNIYQFEGPSVQRADELTTLQAALDAQRVAYEKLVETMDRTHQARVDALMARNKALEASHLRELEGINEAHAKEVETLLAVQAKHDKRLMIVIGILTSFIIILLTYVLGVNIYDMTHPDRGWIQYAMESLKNLQNKLKIFSA